MPISSERERVELARDAYRLIERLMVGTPNFPRFGYDPYGGFVQASVTESCEFRGYEVVTTWAAGSSPADIYAYLELSFWTSDTLGKPERVMAYTVKYSSVDQTWCTLVEMPTAFLAEIGNSVRKFLPQNGKSLSKGEASYVMRHLATFCAKLDAEYAQVDIDEVTLELDSDDGGVMEVSEDELIFEPDPDAHTPFLLIPFVECA